jgi:hypothetical protein
MVSKFGAFVVGFGVPLGFILARLENGLPQSWVEIAVVAGLGAVAAMSFLLAVNELLIASKHPPLVDGVGSLTAVAILACALLAGAFAGLASADEADPGRQGSTAYAKHLQTEIDELRRAGSLEDLESPPSRQGYARRAKAIGDVYAEVSADLRLLEVSREDRLAHRLIVRRVAATGRAYHYLGNMVSEPGVGAKTVSAARAAVAKRAAALIEGIRRLERNGYVVQS